jgi:hypothetical protein
LIETEIAAAPRKQKRGRGAGGKKENGSATQERARLSGPLIRIGKKIAPDHGLGSLSGRI